MAPADDDLDPTRAQGVGDPVAGARRRREEADRREVALERLDGLRRRARAVDLDLDRGIGPPRERRKVLEDRWGDRRRAERERRLDDAELQVRSSVPSPSSLIERLAPV